MGAGPAAHVMEGNHLMSLSSAVRMTGLAKAEMVRLAMGLGVVGVTVAGLTAVSTGALFTDTKDVTGNTFATGKVELTASPSSAALTLSSMAPGDSVVNELTIANSGSLQQRYSVVSATTEDILAHQLVLTVKTGVTTCSKAGFAASGTQLYSGWLGKTGGLKVFGDSTPGAQAGDRVLDAGSSEKLCAMVALPTATDNTFQSLTTTATLTFNAEQVVNNP